MIAIGMKHNCPKLSCDDSASDEDTAVEPSSTDDNASDADDADEPIKQIDLYIEALYESGQLSRPFSREFSSSIALFASNRDAQLEPSIDMVPRLDEAMAKCFHDMIDSGWYEAGSKPATVMQAVTLLNREPVRAPTWSGAGPWDGLLHWTACLSWKCSRLRVASGGSRSSAPVGRSQREENGCLPMRP